MNFIDDWIENIKKLIDSEYESAFRHFNLTADDIPKRTSFAEDENGNQALMIDGEPALIIHKPKISPRKATWKIERLYEREAAE
ncbi:hypothetical protein P9D51_22690 [Bacillus sonorensis]|uniref:hypothetical protein n=1 Tax=Bacillus sonorensis TaxID=119858 RepID=UPI00228117A7|nr:hypothetical protein [Bacillus sonorensis]MCY8035622.1 hypothetical protein [Bacillus sonorensis]MCY8563683.1 hypothetical protein [Bacillus sonorensis]MEC1428852.1 hypothetical protein [Bacillus sonorensis]